MRKKILQQNILDIVDNEFNIIKLAREIKGLSKQDLADLTGLHLRTIQRIERMKLDQEYPDISLKSLLKVMGVLGINITLSI